MLWPTYFMSYIKYVSFELLGFWFWFFSLFFVSGPCARLSWPSRQLLSARKSTVSYRIVHTRSPSWAHIYCWQVLIMLGWWLDQWTSVCDSSDFGLLLSFGGAKFPKWEILCFGRRWTAVQNFSSLALSSAEKSVTIQTNKQNYT